MKMRGTIVCSALVLASGFSVLALAETPAAKAAATAIQKLADDVGKKDWASLGKASSDVAKNNELEDVMNLLKLRRPGAKVVGLGIGPNAGKITPDGIEAKIISLKSKPMAIGEQADLIRMAEITAAVAATATHQCNVDSKMGKKDPALWKTFTRDMYDSSQDLIKALKTKNIVGVKSAANKLSTTCSSCHEIFRD
jgi:hypothetical protein